jgi:hypothetical protein
VSSVPYFIVCQRVVDECGITAFITVIIVTNILAAL